MSDTAPKETHPPCKEIIQLGVRVNQLEKNELTAAAERRQLLDFMAGTKMLQSLALGGGLLSIVNIIILLIQLANR